ncbi:uncharacterized protein [Bos mutus]|uniref:uncharacterized protein n=1 Tax=Bos mutus TaxID=72004 RepID=UPI0038B44E6F
MEPPRQPAPGQPLSSRGSNPLPCKSPGTGRTLPPPARCAPREHPPPPQPSSAGAEPLGTLGTGGGPSAGLWAPVLPGAGVGRGVRAGSPAPEATWGFWGMSRPRCIASRLLTHPRLFCRDGCVLSWCANTWFGGEGRYGVELEAVQRLRLRAPNAGHPGSIPGWGTRSHVHQLKIPYATTKTEDPACCSQDPVQPKKKEYVRSTILGNSADLLATSNANKTLCGRGKTIMFSPASQDPGKHAHL